MCAPENGLIPLVGHFKGDVMANNDDLRKWCELLVWNWSKLADDIEPLALADPQYAGRRDRLRICANELKGAIASTGGPTPSAHDRYEELHSQHVAERDAILSHYFK
jgi:hypothetical protein